MKRGDEVLKRFVKCADFHNGDADELPPDEKNFDVVDAAFGAMVEGNGDENVDKLVCSIFAVRKREANKRGWSDEHDFDFCTEDDIILCAKGVTRENFVEKKKQLLLQCK